MNLQTSRQIALNAIKKGLPLEEVREAVHLYNAYAQELNEKVNPYKERDVRYLDVNL